MKLLTIRVGTEELTFTADQKVRVGRDPESDVLISNTNVSRDHALVVNEAGIWQLIDVGSSQGTWRDGRKVEKVEIRGTVHVTLGREDRGASIVLEASAGAEGEPVRPGGSLNELEESAATEMVGAPREGRGRMDETVIVNDPPPDLEAEAQVGQVEQMGQEPMGQEPAPPAAPGPARQPGEPAPPVQHRSSGSTVSPLLIMAIAAVVLLVVVLLVAAFAALVLLRS